MTYAEQLHWITLDCTAVPNKVAIYSNVDFTFHILRGQIYIVEMKQPHMKECRVHVVQFMDSGCYLLVSLFMEQLAQVVQAAGDWAFVGVGVFQVLIWDISAGQEGALGLIKATLIH